MPLSDIQVDRILYLYKEREKIVPADLSLRPKTLLHWWLGDGTLSWGARFCMDGFDHFYIRRFIRLLRDRFDWKRSLKSFFDYIGWCPEELTDCFGYKFDLAGGGYG